MDKIANRRNVLSVDYTSISGKMEQKISKPLAYYKVRTRKCNGERKQSEAGTERTGGLL